MIMKACGSRLSIRVRNSFKIYLLDVFRENSPDLMNSWAVTVIFLLASLLSLYKNTYLDVNIKYIDDFFKILLCFYFFNWKIKKELTYKKIILMDCLIGLAACMDLIWISVHSE